MRRSVRRLIGLGLSLVFGTAALLQAAVPACGHHEVHASPGDHVHHAATATPSGDAYAQHAAHVHHAPPLAPAPASPDTPSPCDCIDDCCATAMPLGEDPLGVGVGRALLGRPQPVHRRAATLPALREAALRPRAGPVSWQGSDRRSRLPRDWHPCRRAFRRSRAPTGSHRPPHRRRLATSELKPPAQSPARRLVLRPGPRHRAWTRTSLLSS